MLWCETWCAADTFDDALTIDLCNNPETKESKLDMARRIIPEWTKYDNELRAFVDKWGAQRQASNNNNQQATEKSSGDEKHKGTQQKPVHTEL